MGHGMCKNLQGNRSMCFLLGYLSECLCLFWDTTEMTTLTAVFCSERLRQPSNDLLEMINYCWLIQIEWDKLYKKPHGKTKLSNFWSWFSWEIFIFLLWDTGENIDYRMLLLLLNFLQMFNTFPDFSLIALKGKVLHHLIPIVPLHSKEAKRNRKPFARI